LSYAVGPVAPVGAWTIQATQTVTVEYVDDDLTLTGMVYTSSGPQADLTVFPQNRKLWLSLHNLSGDGQADLSVHGGRDKAMYAYPQ
jgi:MOSC domain-containing protein YiiM